MMDVSDIVLRSVPTVTVHASLREVAEIMAQRGGGAVLVVDDEGKVMGVVTEAVLADALNTVVGASEPVVGPRRSRGHRDPRHPALQRHAPERHVRARAS